MLWCFLNQRLLYILSLEVVSDLCWRHPPPLYPQHTARQQGQMGHTWADPRVHMTPSWVLRLGPLGGHDISTSLPRALKIREQNKTALMSLSGYSLEALSHKLALSTPNGLNSLPRRRRVWLEDTTAGVTQSRWTHWISPLHPDSSTCSTKIIYH